VVSGSESREKSTLIATFGGWGLDGLDVMVYPFLISTLMAFGTSALDRQACWHGDVADLGAGGWLADCSPIVRRTGFCNGR